MGVDVETALALLDSIEAGLNDMSGVEGVIPFFMMAYEDAMSQLQSVQLQRGEGILQ